MKIGLLASLKIRGCRGCLLQVPRTLLDREVMTRSGRRSRSRRRNEKEEDKEVEEETRRREEEEKNEKEEKEEKGEEGEEDKTRIRRRRRSALPLLSTYCAPIACSLSAY
jgi:hypothetical protein